MQVILLTEELLATAKQNAQSGLVTQPDADVSPGQEPYNGALQFNMVSCSNLKIVYFTLAYLFS